MKDRPRFCAALILSGDDKASMVTSNFKRVSNALLLNPFTATQSSLNRERAALPNAPSGFCDFSQFRATYRRKSDDPRGTIKWNHQRAFSSTPRTGRNVRRPGMRGSHREFSVPPTKTAGPTKINSAIDCGPKVRGVLGHPNDENNSLTPPFTFSRQFFSDEFILYFFRGTETQKKLFHGRGEAFEVA